MRRTAPSAAGICEHGGGDYRFVIPAVNENFVMFERFLVNRLNAKSLAFERLKFPEPGGRRDSNPQQPESQSGALPLSYGHHNLSEQSLRFLRIRLCKQRASTFSTGPTNCQRRCPENSPQRVRCDLPASCHSMQGGFGLPPHFSATLTTASVAQQGTIQARIFLKAYLSAQQGKKLEHQDRFGISEAQYRFAGPSLIEELRQLHVAQWQPAVVEYRGRKISEEPEASGATHKATCLTRVPVRYSDRLAGLLRVMPGLEPGPEALCRMGNSVRP